MTQLDGFDRNVIDWLDEQAGHGMPGYLDEALARTIRTRQRPWWSSPERWLPMQTTLRFAPAPRIAWLLVVLALIVGLVSAILVVGSHRQVAPPFGLARNGPMAYTKYGDIVRFDPATGVTTPLVTGVEQDVAPYYSPDGERFAFLRHAAVGGDVAATADADGRDIRILTAPLEDQRWWDWSRDGTRLAIISTVDGLRAITVANVDGSGSHVLPLEMNADFVSWLGGADRLLFRGRPPAGGTSGLFTVKPDGTDLVRVSPDMGDDLGDYQAPSVAPDGQRVAYSAFDHGTWHSPTVGSPAGDWSGNLLQVHVLDIITGTESVIPTAADPTSPELPVDQWSPRFSPDGTMLAFQVDRSDGTYQIAVAPVDGSALPRPLGPSARKAADEDPNYEFSPDGTKVNARYPLEGVIWALPIDGSAGSKLPWDASDLPTTQRLAP
ncbi:MAG: TolB family protein [Chloroflexota bacterium]